MKKHLSISVYLSLLLVVSITNAQEPLSPVDWYKDARTHRTASDLLDEAHAGLIEIFPFGRSEYVSYFVYSNLSLDKESDICMTTKGRVW